ncbi:hypothetical protein [Streptomyces sp. NPDC059802]
MVTTITEVNKSRGRAFAILDAGINALGGLSGLGRVLPLQAIPR